ncbi:type III-B CRISPR module-associated protein Cmr5 [Sorangium sp. So ce1014]|uniref:type III-B CRISPR module-associated protein Cmr5 n=1 Tax=Sorangium sp. So ce1014 TaxID=3133326 RepID=UPI003F621294
MPSLDQQRALLAHEHITAVKALPDEKQRKRYGGMVHRLPALVRSAGLSQALHFVSSRKPPEQKLVLEHLADQLKHIDPSIKGGAALLDAVRRAELPRYLALTREALACVDWYRRLVQGELGIEAGEQDDDSE